MEVSAGSGLAMAEDPIGFGHSDDDAGYSHSDPIDEAEEEQEAQDDGVTDTPAPIAEDDFSDLEALLDESMGVLKESAAVKAAKDRLKRGGLSLREKLADEIRVAEWQLKHEWEAVANAVHFSRQVCACGHASSVFLGLMERQQHRHLKNGTQRWFAVKESKAALPNEVIIRTISVPVCECCALDKGWDFTKATEWKDSL